VIFKRWAHSPLIDSIKDSKALTCYFVDSPKFFHGMTATHIRQFTVEQKYHLSPLRNLENVNVLVRSEILLLLDMIPELMQLMHGILLLCVKLS
jgi:hypothetical protein